MFGSSTNTPFGTSTGFGTGNSCSSLFGGRFGQHASGASGPADKGTPVKFVVVQGNDSMVKNGITTNISVRHQCITVMSNYDKKSIEELRIEDYEAGRKTGGFSICTTTGSLFGNTSGTAFSTSSSLPGLQPAIRFGTPGSLFGSSPTNAVLFGQQQTTEGLGQNAGSQFGVLDTTGKSTATGFSFPAASAGFKFGTTQTTTSLLTPTTTGSLFGSSSKPAVLFGQQQTTERLDQNAGSLFGTPALSATGASIFGQSSSGQTGQPKGDQEVECKDKAVGSTGFTLLSTSTSKGDLFGNTSGTGFGASSSLFGQKPTTGFGATGGLFGSSSGTAVLFGQQQTAKRLDQNVGNLFGTPTSSTTGTSIFGQSSSGQTEQPKDDQEVKCKNEIIGSTGFTLLSRSTSNGGLFGNTSGTGFDASSSLFGQKPTTGFGATGSIFGSSSATAGLFGQQQTAEGFGQNTGSLFGTATLSTTGTSIFGQSSSGQTEQPTGDQEVECKNETIGSTGFTLLSTSTSKGGLFGNTSGTGFGTSSSLFGQKPTTGFGTTGSLSVNSSTTTGEFGQEQTTEGFLRKADVLINTTSRATENRIKFATTTSSASELSTGLSVATSTSVGLSLPETKSTTFGCGQTQADTGELLEQTGLRLSQEQDDPPSLSPRFSLSEAMSEGMEELRKENESLRKVIKMYKESEKAIEELRRFYIAQASKHKENMEQAVSHKFLELVSKVRGLKTIRDATPEDGKISHDRSVLIRETIDLTRNNRIDLESLKSLHQVQECESALQHAQECLRQCKDKEELLATDIVAQRDKARKDLYDSIDLFCQEVDLIPLQERENSLQHALSQLQEQGESFDSCSTDPDIEVAVEAYEEWLQRSHQEVIDVKQRVNQCTEDLTTALSRLELALKLSQDSSETGSMHAPFGDLDEMISSLSSAIQEEMDKCQVSEDKEANQIVDCAIKALITELKREMANIQELRDNLVLKYKSLQTDMSPWLEAKPDLKNVEEVRATIESLRLRLRERLADKKDLEEVESDISDIYLQLHKSFEDESNFLAELAKVTSEHFPELPIAHPEVGISEFLASNGLVKPGRELEHYPHYDSVPSVSHDKCSVIKTEFAGRPCILKELDVDRELGGIETLQRKAVDYHNVDCPFLMPLDAFFVTGSRAFVQMPLLISGEDWLTSHECSSEAITLVLRDILDALNSLHLRNICHGSVHLQSVFVEKRSGEYRGILDFFPFTNSQCSQTEDMKLFGDLIVKMNFPNKDTTTTISQLTEDTDLLAVLGDLLDSDDVDRLTAQQTLQQAYFCKCV